MRSGRDPEQILFQLPDFVSASSEKWSDRDLSLHDRALPQRVSVRSEMRSGRDLQTEARRIARESFRPLRDAEWSRSRARSVREG